MKVLQITLVSLLMIFVAVNTTSGQELSLGPLASIIEPGSDDSWTVTMGEKGAQLVNRQAAGGIRYYYVNEDPKTAGSRTVSVTVQLLDSGSGALGGLLYGFQDNPKSYFLFTVGANGTVNLHFRGPDSFEQRMQSSLDSAPNSPVTLSITEKGDEITLFVNGNNIGSLGNSRMGRGALGIAAVDTGTFRFSQFSIK